MQRGWENVPMMLGARDLALPRYSLGATFSTCGDLQPREGRVLATSDFSSASCGFDERATAPTSPRRPGLADRSEHLGRHGDAPNES